MPTSPDEPFVLPLNVLDASSERPCPICERVISKPQRCKQLYGVPVCRKCRDGFANRRQAAFLIDWVICWIVFAGATRLAWAATSPTLQVSMAWKGILGPIAAYLLAYLLWPALLALKDGFAGLSPGRALLGIRVVDAETLEPIGFRQSLTRNLPLFLPVLGVLGIILTMMKGPRWGDGWARTVVVWDRYAFKPPFDPRGIRCLHCGYNLTGNVSGICPECGTPVASPPPPADPGKQ